VARLCDVRGIPHAVLGRDVLDLTDPAAVEAAVAGLRRGPWCTRRGGAGGWARVDAAEHDPDACRRATVDAAAHVAEACGRHGARLVAFSSDLVFDGGAGDMRRVGPYVESDPVAPLGVYGRCHAAMEAAVLGALPAALVARTSACFGPWDGGGSVGDALRALARGEAVAAASDVTVSPTYVVDLVHAALDLLVDGERGLWHLANLGQVTWADFVRRAAEAAGVDAGRWSRVRCARSAAPRRGPRYSVLGSSARACSPRSTTRSRATAGTARWPARRRRPATARPGATARGATSRRAAGCEVAPRG
jgi:dTDP-4-dehydrorhamnose reductase